MRLSFLRQALSSNPSALALLPAFRLRKVSLLFIPALFLISQPHVARADNQSDGRCLRGYYIFIPARDFKERSTQPSPAPAPTPTPSGGSAQNSSQLSDLLNNPALYLDQIKQVFSAGNVHRIDFCPPGTLKSALPVNLAPQPEWRTTSGLSTHSVRSDRGSNRKCLLGYSIPISATLIKLDTSPSSVTEDGSNGGSESRAEDFKIPEDTLKKLRHDFSEVNKHRARFCSSDLSDSVSYSLAPRPIWHSTPAYPYEFSPWILLILLVVNTLLLIAIAILFVAKANQPHLLTKDDVCDSIKTTFSDLVSDHLVSTLIQPNMDTAIKSAINNALLDYFGEHGIISRNHDAIPAIVEDAINKAFDEYSEKLALISPAPAATPRSHLVTPDNESEPSETPDQGNNQSKSIVDEYKAAYSPKDRSLLRKIYTKELKITEESEQALQNSTAQQTILEAVGSGGSYLLIPANDRTDHAWIVPDWQTLESYANSRPNKGVFSYDYVAGLGSPELRQPAEVKQVGDRWQVVNMGVIAVPG